MRIIHRSLLFIFLIWTNIGYSQYLAQFQDEQYGFSIEYPQNWQLMSNNLTGTMPFKVCSPRMDTRDFQEYVKILVLNTGDKNLETCFEGNMLYMKQNVPGFDMAAYGDIQVGRKLAKWATYSYTVDPKKMKLGWKGYFLPKKVYTAKSYTFFHEGKGFVITCTAEKKEFKKHEKMFDRIAQSLVFELKTNV